MTCDLRFFPPHIALSGNSFGIPNSSKDFTERILLWNLMESCSQSDEIVNSYT